MNTDRDWEVWGKKDPYYGVLASEQFRSGRIEQHREHFFDSGAANVSTFIDRFERSFGPLPRGSALDFGCGVGRLTLALAKQFKNVVGIDVSESMLAEARSNASRTGLGNATFASGNELANQGSFDFVNSYIVLQHIPPAKGMPIVAQLLQMIRPGGGCMLHLSVKRRTSAVKRAIYWLRVHVPLAHGMANLLRGNPWSEPMMQMNEYPMDRVLELFEQNGMHEVRAFIESHAGTLTVGLLGYKQ